ncbi:MAG: peroxiredoxin [Rhizobiaceae bacterium]
MQIEIGASLPETTFLEMTADGPAQVSSESVFSGKKVVLFAVPGAFTPTCHNNHLPGFLENYDTILGMGVDEIAVVSVNDVWVMGEWAKASRAQGKIRFLADGSGAFTKAVGMEADLGAAGMGLRSKRYSMIIEDRVVKAVNVEEKRGVAELSGAAHILEQLKS